MSAEIADPPPHWTAVALSDVAEVIRGVTYKKHEAEDRPGPGLVPLLRSGNVQAGELTFDKLVYVPRALVNDRQMLRAGDIVVSTSNSRELVGKSAPSRDSRDATFGAFLTVVRPLANVNPRYLALYMQSPVYLAEIARLSAATNNIANIRSSDLAAFPVGLPSRDEQDSIVAKVEALLGRTTEGRNAFDAALDGITRYEASVFAEALRGALADRVERSASAKSFLEELGVESIERPEDASYPAHWETARLGDLASHITSGSRDWKPYYDQGDGVFVLTQNVRMRRLDLSHVSHVDPPAADPARIRSEIKRDDLLITIVGANVGNTARVPVELVDHWVCQSLALVRPKATAMSEFLELYLAAPTGGQAFFEQCYYGQGRPHINFADLKRMPVPVPPADEQAAIVASFDAQTEAINDLRATCHRAITASDALVRAILHQASTGGLSGEHTVPNGQGSNAVRVEV